jgi:hypothetical protein
MPDSGGDLRQKQRTEGHNSVTATGWLGLISVAASRWALEELVEPHRRDGRSETHLFVYAPCRRVARIAARPHGRQTHARIAHDRDREAIQSRAKSLSGMRLVHCIEPDFAGLFRFI